MASNLYTFSLLGTTITIRTEEDLQYIRQIENRVALAIKEVKEDLGLAEPLAVALMAGVFLADENFKLKRQAPSNLLQSNQIDEGLGKLDKMLDQATRNIDL